MKTALALPLLPSATETSLIESFGDAVVKVESGPLERLPDPSLLITRKWYRVFACSPSISCVWLVSGVASSVVTDP